jgi:biopolymer transport protein ExbB
MRRALRRDQDQNHTVEGTIMIRQTQQVDAQYAATRGQWHCRLTRAPRWCVRVAILGMIASPALVRAANGQALDTAQSPVFGEATLPRDLSPWGMFTSADIVVKAVIVGLAFASVVTWTVWLAKSIEIVVARRRVGTALRSLADAASLSDARSSNLSYPAVEFLDAAVAEFQLSADALAHKDGVKERIASRFERIEAACSRRISRGTGVLATIGATAPFVGLFGTVWGIMNSFIGISKSHTTNLAIVAPGIAEALLATAFGLAAAIPAVVIYNVFARSIGGYRILLGDTAAEFLRLVSRDLDRGTSMRARVPAAAE